MTDFNVGNNFGFQKIRTDVARGEAAETAYVAEQMEELKAQTDLALDPSAVIGKSQVVVIQSQLGVPICAFSGEKVRWEIPDDLPKMTKLMIDGKALYIHRANFEIIDKALLK